MDYAYITNKTFPDGEIAVEARASDGALLFGFRTRSFFGWREQARAWTPSKYIPVFQAKPAEYQP